MRFGGGAPHDRSMPSTHPTRPATGTADRLDDRRAAELVERMRAGDRDAAAECYRLLAPFVRHIVSDNVPQRADADDIVQEVFVRALQRLDTLREPALLRPWIASIARRAAIDHRRVRVAGRTIPDPTAGARHLDPAPGPDAVAEGRDDLRRVHAALGTLPARDAQALALIGRHGAGPADLAASFGISVTAAKVCVHRARARLRRALDAGTSPAIA
jgi:RNA polymerase sigma factor (sigma-70 family)